MRKKILINLLSFSEEKFYGVGAYFRDIVVNSFEDLIEKEDCHLVILHLKHIPVKNMFNIPDNTSIEYLSIDGVNGRFKRILYEQLILPIKFGGYDVIYSPNNINPLILSGLGKSIITIHDLLPFKRSNRFGLFQKFYLKIFTYLSAHMAAEIVTVSNHSLTEITRFLNVDRRKVSVTYNVTFIDSNVKQAPLVHQPYFFSIGALQTDKQYELMIRAFYEFMINNEGTSSFKLLIAGGDHGLKNDLDSLIASLNLQENVTLLGFISDTERANYYKNCTATLLLGKSEGFGIPVIESMIFNKPVIVSNLGALPEIVGNAGVIVESNVHDVALAMNNIMLMNISSEIFSLELKRFDHTVQKRTMIEVFKRALSS